MKFFIRLFFRTLRRVLGPFMLLKEALTKPKGMQRTAALQTAVNAQCQSLALYQFSTCPFCIRVRQEIRRLSLPIKRIDAQAEGVDRQALVAGGGQAKVPCLKITHTDGSHEWLYDSGNIIGYLHGRFAAA
ncbi:MAG: glutaredoxin [Chitinophagaceae bacterium]|nr:glutaredoxin [Polaromonas sp.]